MKYRVLLASLLLPAASSHAQQDYPARPLRLVVPYPPGGPTDIVGRLASDVLARRLSQNVVVDNRGGAATAIGAEMVARAPADGYTLLLSSETTFAVNPALTSKLPYHPERDFSPISLLTTQPYVLAVTLSLPASSVSQLVAYAGVQNLGYPAYLAACVAGTIPFAVASWWLVEQPSLSMRRLEPKSVVARIGSRSRVE